MGEANKGEFPEDRNMLASRLVIASIAQFPQAMDGYVLVADKIINQNRVTISEMANIIPDGRYCADKINFIHNRFGINYRVSSRQAVDFVKTFAMGGVSYIKGRTEEACTNMNLKTPRGLTNDELQELLDKNDELRMRVATVVKKRAEEVRKESDKHIKAVQDKHFRDLAED